MPKVGGLNLSTPAQTEIISVDEKHFLVRE
jgi:hypothetical protein